MDQPRQVSSQPQQASAWDEPDPEGCCRSSDGKYFVKGGVVISLAEHVLPQIYENVPDDTILAGQRNGDEYPLYNSNNTYIGGITIEQLDPIFSVVCAEKNVEFAEAVTITAPTIIGRKGNVKPSIKLINKLRDDATNEGVLLEQLAREDGKNKNSKKLKGLLTSAKRENLKSGVVNLMIKEAKDRDVDNDPHGQTQIAQGGVPWGGGAPDPIVPDPAVSIVIMSHGGHQFTSESINNPANNTHYITKWTSVEDAVNTGVCSVSYRTTSRTGTISSKKAFLSPAKDGAELLTELSRSSPKSQFKMQDIGSAIERRAVQTSLPLKITDHNGLQMTERVKDPRYNDKPITKWTSVKNAVESGICELTYYSSIESLNRKAFLFPAKKAAEQLATLYAQKGDFLF